MNREDRVKAPYCSLSLRPCEVMFWQEKISDYCYGRSAVQFHDKMVVCTCHHEETIDRRRALLSWWSDRCRRERRKQKSTNNAFKAGSQKVA